MKKNGLHLWFLGIPYRFKNCPTAIRRSSLAISSPRCTNLFRATVLNCWAVTTCQEQKGVFLRFT